MKIITLRVEIAAGDSAKTADVKALLTSTIRSLGAMNPIPDDFAEVTSDMTVLYNSADVKQGLETFKKKARS